MDENEKYIESQCGRKLPFTMPSDLLDGLAERVMAETGNQQESAQSTPERRHPWTFFIRHRAAVASVAACVCLAVAGAGLWWTVEENSGDGRSDSLSSVSTPVAGQQQTAAANQESYSNVDAAVDYSMMDNSDMYAIMASAE